MAGFLLGPALGALAASVTRSEESVFVLGGISVAAAGVVIAFLVPEGSHHARSHGLPPEGLTEVQRESPQAVERAAAAAMADRDVIASPSPSASAPTSLRNRTLIGAIVLNFGGFFAGGTWEVIWSLFMQAHGASIEFIGFTFALFSLPVLLVSPFVGRLVDRRGPMPYLIAGTLGAIVTGIAYTLTGDLLVISVIVIVEALGWAFVNPALYAIVGAGSPPGRSSTAQGLFGAAGTLAYIASAVFAGTLFARDLRYPFYLLVAVVAITLVAGLAIIGPRRVLRPSAATTLAPRPEPGS